MNISTDLDEISPDLSKPKGGYEWWYFDGLSSDGEYGFVIIFYHENPFSTKLIRELDEGEKEVQSHPAISVSVYHKSKPIYYSFLEFGEDAFSWSGDSLTLNLEKNKVQYSITNETFGFEIHLDQELDSGHSIEGVISGKGGLSSPDLITSNSSERHLWNLILPTLSFQADLKLKGRAGQENLRFEGHGYHDHNIGEEPMKDSFKDWYWGRYHFEEMTLIYYLMNKHNEQQFEAWLIDRDNQSVISHLDEASLEYFNTNWFGLRSARKIELKEGQTSVIIQCRDKIDDGPFYQRFIGDSIINYNGQVIGAKGFSEYIYPKNIYQRKFWPLVHMRLRYMQEDPHWVQKSHLMYPWTW